MAAPDRWAGSSDPAPGNFLGPGTRSFTVTAGAGDLPFLCRYFHVSGAAGSITYVDQQGNTQTETLEVGYHPNRLNKITAIAGGTTVVIWD
jgi:hypothetical protein